MACSGTCAVWGVRFHDVAVVVRLHVSCAPQDTPGKLNIVELGKGPWEAFRVTPQDLPQPADGAADFPVGMKARLPIYFSK